MPQPFVCTAWVPFFPRQTRSLRFFDQHAVSLFGCFQHENGVVHFVRFKGLIHSVLRQLPFPVSLPQLLFQAVFFCLVPAISPPAQPPGPALVPATSALPVPARPQPAQPKPQRPELQQQTLDLIHPAPPLSHSLVISCICGSPSCLERFVGRGG